MYRKGTPSEINFIKGISICMFHCVLQLAGIVRDLDALTVGAILVPKGVPPIDLRGRAHGTRNPVAVIQGSYQGRC